MNIVSFSGGKDSTAMLIKMIEDGISFDEVVFADTTMEFPEMYEYIDKIESIYGLEIKRVQPDKSFNDWFYGAVTRGRHEGKERGWPLLTAHCYWSREVKDKALKSYTRGNIVYLGIALDESRRICEHPDFTAKYPLVDWLMTEADCAKFLRDRNLENPLYKNFRRTGCYLCPKQSIASLYTIYDKYPDLWEMIEIRDKTTESVFRPGYTIEKLNWIFKEKKSQLELF